MRTIDRRDAELTPSNAEISPRQLGESLRLGGKNFPKLSAAQNYHITKYVLESNSTGEGLRTKND